MKSRTIKRLATVILLAMAPTTLVACAKGGSTASSEDTAGGTLTMWTHNAGNKNELAAIEAIVTDFNASQTEVQGRGSVFPAGFL